MVIELQLDDKGKVRRYDGKDALRMMLQGATTATVNCGEVQLIYRFNEKGVLEHRYYPDLQIFPWETCLFSLYYFTSQRDNFALVVGDE